ncbi:MAG: NAD(P)/FAD-dependent oxidoreductase [Comamonadaceae bacterium]|nr:NAD(P)/FAD-dependent oxidoreductase [Comamonadaceae bacterium]
MTDSKATLHEMLQHASIPALVMCLAQITEDDRWLEEPFRPRRDTNLFADESGGLPENTQQVVRQAAEKVLGEIERGERVLPPMPSAERFLRMMRVNVAEDIAPEYVPMMMEEMHFSDRSVPWTNGKPAAASQFNVMIIGAGVSGICAAIKLDELGIAWTLVEKNSQVGGTWYENTYPDAGVDTPNHFYSYSFEPNFRWSSYFSKSAEVQAYVHGVAARKKVLERIRFDTEVESLTWDESSRSWSAVIRKSDGSKVTEQANAIISAVGQLNRPKTPAIPGIETFTGQAFHSAHWRHDIDLHGKRVAVLGTGASAMQFLPTVAEAAGHLTVFQRSPQWVKPAVDYHRKVTPETKWLLEHVPYYFRWYRFGLLWRYGDGLLRSLRRDPAWPHPERAMNRHNDKHREQLTEHLMKELEGRPDLVPKVLPDYPPYGKRILIDNHWYRTLKRPNVELASTGVTHIEGQNIVASDGESRPFDVLIYATGFEVGKFLHPMQVRGRGGLLLSDVWGDDDPRAYLGITAPNFPNFFCLFGPNTNLAHGGSIIFQAECQTRYVTSCLVQMLETGISAIEVRREVHDDYIERVDSEHNELVWSHRGMNNWYRNAKGRVFAPMPWTLVNYWRMTHDAALNDYHLTPA